MYSFTLPQAVYAASHIEHDQLPILGIIKKIKEKENNLILFVFLILP